MTAGTETEPTQGRFMGTNSVAADGARQTVALDLLVAHPKNTRHAITEESVSALAANLRARGQLSAMIVREREGKYEVLAGHRRLVAMRTLAWPSAVVNVVDVDDAEAERIVIAENADRREPDLLVEGDTVAALLEREGWNIGTVADALGKSKQWVAQRAALSKIAAPIRKRYEAGKMPEWSPRMMELLAHLAPEAQQRFIDECGNSCHGDDSTEAAIAGWARTLDRAPWSLDDETVHAKAGACVTCPKTSAHQPDLFGVDASKATSKEIRCLDGKCWATKMVGHVKRLAAAHAKEAGKPLLLVAGEWDNGSRGIDLTATLNLRGSEDGSIKPARVLHSHEFRVVKKDDKNAEPALVVSGKSQGSLVYVAIVDGRTRGAGGKAKAAKAAKGEKAKEPTLAEREARHRTRVHARALELLREKFSEDYKREDTPTEETVLALLPIYGARVTAETYKTEDRAKALLAVIEKARTSAQEGAYHTWRTLVEEIGRALEPFRAEEADPKWAEATDLCRILGIDFDAINAKAATDVPEPAALLRARKVEAEGTLPMKERAPKGNTTKKKKSKKK